MVMRSPVSSFLKTVPKELKNPAILEEAMGILEEGAFSPEELAAYEKMIDDRRTQDSIFASAELRGELRGEQRGEQRGELRGLERGLEKGLEQGELQKAQAIARNMLAENEPPAKISKFTGLSVEEIEKLG